MTTLTYEYIAQTFRPRTDAAQSLLLFVAPAAEIRSWAGVPRKAFDYQHGFQRTLNPDCVTEVAQYFMEDPKNISPTALQHRKHRRGCLPHHLGGRGFPAGRAVDR